MTTPRSTSTSPGGEAQDGQQRPEERIKGGQEAERDTDKGKGRTEAQERRKDCPAPEAQADGQGKRKRQRWKPGETEDNASPRQASPAATAYQTDKAGGREAGEKQGERRGKERERHKNDSITLPFLPVAESLDCQHTTSHHNRQSVPGQPRSPGSPEINSAFVEYAELPLIDGLFSPTRDGGGFTF